MIRWVAVALQIPIRLYRWAISPLLPNRCRFYPSCSAYALQALDAHGPWKGLFLIGRRLVRCHPWHPGGLDQVPSKEMRVR